MLQFNWDLRRDGDSWSQLFDKLEQLSGQLNWDDYSLSQTTLEQVFIEFSRDAAMQPGQTPPQVIDVYKPASNGVHSQQPNSDSHF